MKRIIATIIAGLALAGAAAAGTTPNGIVYKYKVPSTYAGAFVTGVHKARPGAPCGWILAKRGVACVFGARGTGIVLTRPGYCRYVMYGIRDGRVVRKQALNGCSTSGIPA